MRILGIDPGYAILGYGIIEMKGNRFNVIDGQAEGFIQFSHGADRAF